MWNWDVMVEIQIFKPNPFAWCLVLEATHFLLIYAIQGYLLRLLSTNRHHRKSETIKSEGRQIDFELHRHCVSEIVNFFVLRTLLFYVRSFQMIFVTFCLKVSEITLITCIIFVPFFNRLVGLVFSSWLLFIYRVSPYFR